MTRAASKRALEVALEHLVPGAGKVHRAVASQIDAVVPQRLRPSVTPICLAKGQAHVWLAYVPGLPEHGLYEYRCYTGHSKASDPDGCLSLRFARCEQAKLVQQQREWRRHVRRLASKRGAA